MPGRRIDDTSSTLGPGTIERLWSGETGRWGSLLDLALAPLELLYRMASGVHHSAYSTGRRSIHRLPVPVVSVGNLAVGGTGKTPFTRWVVGELQRRGCRPAVLHGGYAPDEPALHRAWNPEVPVVVDRDRVAGGRRAIEAGADVLVLDDAFQHRRLARDLDFVLIAAEDWTCRPKLLPRGPWRESPEALSRAHAVVVTRKVATEEAAAAVLEEVTPLAPGAKKAQVHLRPAGWSIVGGREAMPRGTMPGSPSAAGHFVPGVTIAGSAEGPSGEAMAVAGVAKPGAFLANARAQGAMIGPVMIFRDHHRYNESDVRRIRDVAAGRAIVTTAKDAVKLAPLAPDLKFWVLEQNVTVERGADELLGLFDGLLA